MGYGRKGQQDLKIQVMQRELDPCEGFHAGARAVEVTWPLS